jgi:integrase
MLINQDFTHNRASFLGGSDIGAILGVSKYLSAIHKLNRYEDPTKDPDVALEMRRMHRKLGRSSRQAGSINADTLDKLLLATDDSIRGIRDRALLLVAYDTLCRRSEIVSLQVKDVKINMKNDIETSSILLRKSKTDQDSTGKWLHLSQRAHLALMEWMKELPEGQEYLMVGIDRGRRISQSSLGPGQVNRIYKRIARNTGLNELVIKMISGHSMRVGAAQDLLNSGASMPIIMQRGRWSKTDTVMRYVEHGSCAG